MKKRIKSPTSEKELVEAINEVSNEVVGKQEKLTAGQNITIDGNTISSKSELSFDYDSLYNKPSINGIVLSGDQMNEDLKINHIYKATTDETTGTVSAYKIHEPINLVDGLIFRVRFPRTNKSNFSIEINNNVLFPLQQGAMGDRMPQTMTVIAGGIYTLCYIDHKLYLLDAKLVGRDILWQGATKEVIKIENCNGLQYSFYKIYIAQTADVVLVVSGAILPAAATVPRENGETIMLYHTLGSNDVSTYTGRMHIDVDAESDIYPVTKFITDLQFTNVLHNSGGNHGGTGTYLIRQIDGYY